MRERGRRLALLSIGRRDIYSVIDIDYIVLKNGGRIKYEGMPDDAKLVYYYLNSVYDSLDLVIESESFSEVPEGAFLPRPEYETHLSKNEDNPNIFDKTIKILFSSKQSEEK